MKCFIILFLLFASFSFAQVVNDKKSITLEDELKQLLLEQQDLPALVLALSKPKEAEAVLDQFKGSKSRSEYIGWLIQSEILFSEKKNDEALVLLKKFIAKIEPVGSQKTWKDGVIPASYYLSNHPNTYTNIASGGIADNLILQRLLQFKQDDLADDEYQRILVTKRMLGEPAVLESQVIQLQTVYILDLSLNLDFIIEHYNFLRSRKKSDRAKNLLLRKLDSLELNSIFKSTPDIFGHQNYINGKPPMRVEQFIKICYGYFKLDNKVDELLAHLAQSKSKSALLIRAKIEAQLGNHDEALKLAIKHAHRVESTPSNLAYRLGKTYHYFSKYEEAIVEFEKFMSIDLNKEPKPKMNDLGLAQSQIDARFFNAELQKCYLATNNTKKLIQTKLAAILYTRNNRVYSDLEAISEFASKVNHEEVYSEWSSRVLKEKGISNYYKAHIAYVNGDIAQALEYSKQAALKRNLYDYSRWGEIYSKAGKREGWIVILRELYLKANEDQKIYTQRRLINYLRDDATDAEVISLYENILLSNRSLSEERNDGYSASDFSGQGHVANRLLRLYYRNQMFEEFDALAIKIAGIEKYRAETYINANDSDTALAYYISKSSDEKIQALRKHLDPVKWEQTHRLIDWVLAGGVKHDLLNKPMGDLIKTEGFSVIASDQNVRDITKNKSYVFTAHTYGVSVYDNTGVNRRRIFVPNSPHHLAASEECLWIGTADGVYQLNLESWELRRLALRNKIPDSDDELSVEVGTLAFKNSTLWIGCSNNIRMYEVKEKTIRIFTDLELDYSDGHGHWNRFMFQELGYRGDYVWVSGYDGATRRYNTELNMWIKTAPLIGMHRNKVWLSQHINQRLNDRPALFNDVSLNTKPCRISKNGPLPTDWGKSLEELRLVGEFDQQPVFFSTRGGSTYYQFLPDSHELKPLGKNFNVNSLNSAFISTGKYGDRGITEYSNGVIKMAASSWLKLDDDTVLRAFEHYIARSPRVSEIRELKLGRIGLHVFKDKKYSHRISTAGIYGTCVFDVLETSQGVWICSDAGLSLVTKEGSLIANYTTLHGLPEGRCTSAVEINGACFFAFNGDYKKGGLVYLDPVTSRFHILNDVDGLAVNCVDQVRVENNKLKVIYSKVSSAFNNHQKIQYAPMSLDTVKMKFAGRSSSTKVINSRVKDELPAMLHKFGYKLGVKKINTQTWHFGTQGIIIDNDSDTKNLIKDIPVKLIESAQFKMYSHAKAIMDDEKNPLTLIQKLEHSNLYLIEEALNDAIASTQTEELAELVYLIPKVIQLLELPIEKIQTGAAEFLYKVKSKDSIKALLKKTNSENQRVKYLAVLTAAKYSEKLPLEELQNYLNPYLYRSYSENHDEVFKVLLSRGELTDKETIRLLLKYSINPNNGWGRDEPKGYPDFSKTISRKPELIRELLKADDIYKYKDYNRRFMYDLFRKADKSVLPILYEALKSGDRVVAANAALACAAIGDQSSISELIKALEIESALTQHSVIVALKILKAKEAIPQILSIDRILRQISISHSDYNSFAMNANSHFETRENNIELVTTKDEFILPVGETYNKLRNRGSEMTTTLETTFGALQEIAPEMCQPYFREVITSSLYNCRPVLELLRKAQGEEVKENIEFLNNLILPRPDGMKLAEAVKLELMKRK